MSAFLSESAGCGFELYGAYKSPGRAPAGAAGSAKVSYYSGKLAEAAPERLGAQPPVGRVPTVSGPVYRSRRVKRLQRSCFARTSAQRGVELPLTADGGGRSGDRFLGTRIQCSGSGCCCSSVSRQRSTSSAASSMNQRMISYGMMRSSWLWMWTVGS